MADNITIAVDKNADVHLYYGEQVSCAELSARATATVPGARAIAITVS
jgi:hypothetical protein